jgi:hypothetical protein
MLVGLSWAQAERLARADHLRTKKGGLNEQVARRSSFIVGRCWFRITSLFGGQWQTFGRLASFSVCAASHFA